MSGATHTTHYRRPYGSRPARAARTWLTTMLRIAVRASNAVGAAHTGARLGVGGASQHPARRPEGVPSWCARMPELHNHRVVCPRVLKSELILILDLRH